MSNLFFPTTGNYNLYPTQLAALWHGRQWLPNVDWTKYKDPNAWDKVQREPIIRMAIQKRLHAVAAKDWRIEPGGEEDADQRLADFVRWNLNKAKGFTMCRLHSAKAVFLGDSWQQVIGQRKRLKFEGKYDEFWVLDSFEQIDSDRFRWVPMWKNADGSLTPVQQSGRPVDRPSGAKAVRVLEMSSLDRPGQWDRVTDTRSLLFVEYDSEERRLGRGRGILEAVYFYHFAMGILLREMLQLAEKLGQGMTIVKIDPKELGDEDSTNEDVRDDYADKVEQMRARNVLVMSKMDEIQHVFADGSAWSGFIEAIKHLQECCVRLILGGSLPSGGGGEVGSYARSETEADEQEGLIQFDRELQAEAITDTIVRLIVTTNRPQLVAMGLGEAEMPRYAPYQEKKQDPRENAEVAEIMLRSGAKILATEYYERCGWTMPTDGDEVLEQQLPDVPFGAGGFGQSGNQAA